jgi:hypothetical protein
MGSLAFLGDLWTNATLSDSGGTLAPSHEDDSGAGSCCSPAAFAMNAGASVLTIVAVSPPRGASVLPALIEQRRLPTTISLSKLHHAAHILAVYASQLSFPLSRSYGHARLASGWWPAFTGRGSRPRKVPNEVSASSTWLPPHPSFATQSTSELDSARGQPSPIAPSRRRTFSTSTWSPCPFTSALGYQARHDRNGYAGAQALENDVRPNRCKRRGLPMLSRHGVQASAIH